MELRPIGVVRSAVRDRKQVPPLGAPAVIEIFENFAPGLLRIGKHSHIWVMALLDGAERDLLQVTPRGVTDLGPAGLHGVFAVRSPARPNSIGLTAARIVSIDEARIAVDYLDFVDGTPVIDVKPYFASRDLIFSATNEPIGRPTTRETMRDALLFQAMRFHGRLCAGVALAARIVEHLRAEPLAMCEPAGFRITTASARPCLADGLMGIMRITPGRRTLGFSEEDRVRFEDANSAYLYELLAAPEPACSGTLELSPEAALLLECPDNSLFRLR